MDYKARYEEWISNSYFDEDTRAELESIKEDENEIKERFYKRLHVVWLQTGSKHIYLNRCARRRSYLMR